MIYILQESIHDSEPPRLNNPETYVLTRNHFINYIISIFSDLNKTQIYKMLL